MSEKLCPICDQPFERKRGKQRFCSTECWHKSPEGRAQHHAANKRIGAEFVRSKICELCGVAFIKPVTITWARWNKRRFCSHGCWANSSEGKTERSKTMKITLRHHPDMPRLNLEKALEKNPDLCSEGGKKVQRLYADKIPGWGRMGGIIRGKQAVESGQVFTIPLPHVTYGACGIKGHRHRSKIEIALCQKLVRERGQNHVYASVILGGKEIDFAIGEDPSNPTTWEKVIETHSTHWDECQGVDDYESVRRQQLIERGVNCPIEIRLSGNGGKR